MNSKYFVKTKKALQSYICNVRDVDKL